MWKKEVRDESQFIMHNGSVRKSGYKLKIKPLQKKTVNI